jgi:hypothetical protein
VACLIDDIDVIGGSGGNIGYIIKKDEFENEYAMTIKIDPGFAFTFDEY